MKEGLDVDTERARYIIEDVEALLTGRLSGALQKKALLKEVQDWLVKNENHIEEREPS